MLKCAVLFAALLGTSRVEVFAKGCVLWMYMFIMLK